MKYTQRFPNAIIGEEVIPRRLFKDSNWYPCNICGDLAVFVDMDYQSYYCSDECLAEEDRLYNEAIAGVRKEWRVGGSEGLA